MGTFFLMNAEVRQYFVHFTKDELSTILSYFDQPVPKKAKKAELVDIVSDFIGGHPREWLYRLTERDLKLLQLLVNAGPENWKKLESPDYPSVVALLGLIYVDDSGEEEVLASIDRSLYFPVAAILDQVMKEKEDDGSFETERTALGILNIYGAIPVEDFVDTVFTMFDEDGSGKDVTLAMADCQLIAIHRVFYKEKVYLISPYAYDYETIIDGRENFQEVKEYRLFSGEAARQAGLNAPYCAFGAGTEEFEAVRNVLDDLGYDDEEIMAEMHEIWLNAQNAADQSAAEAIFSCVNSRIDDIESFAKYRRCIDIIAAYANSIPKWLLKGSISTEVGLLQLSIKVDESIMDGNGLDETDSEEQLGPLKEFYKYNMAVRHVAPDDPCPCGSGLSYCRCHGKRLN